jgi:surface protein
MLSLPINHYSYNEGLQMVTTWNTENLGGTGSATKVILLPISAGPSVDWGDGTVDNLNTHTYASGGVKTVTIYGQVTGWSFNNGGDCLKITDVSNVGGWRPGGQGFYGCSNLTWSATGPLNDTTSSSFNQLFRGCTAFNGDVSEWDTSNINNISNVFRDCIVFNQDVSGWDTSSCTAFASTFRGCSALNPNIGGWDTSSAIGMNNMVRDSLFNRDISSWDITSVTSATAMMNGSAFSTTNYDLLLPAWEAQSVQDTVTAHFGSATYGAGTPATARAALIADHTWTITDGGPT